MISKYRVKTKQEFIEEFGEEWYKPSRRPLGSTCNFVNGMNSLFGYEIPFYYYSHLDENWFKINNNDKDFRLRVIIPKPLDIDGHLNRYCLSIDMIKEISMVNYNEKKILVYD